MLLSFILGFHYDTYMMYNTSLSVMINDYKHGAGQKMGNWDIKQIPVYYNVN